MELLAALVIKRREELVLDPLDDRLDARELPLAGGGDHDRVPAPVVRIAAALDQASLLEAVQQPDELPAVEAERVGDRPLRSAGALGCEGQHAEVVRAEARG